MTSRDIMDIMSCLTFTRINYADTFHSILTCILM